MRTSGATRTRLRDTGLVYRGAGTYRLTMLALEGRSRSRRYERIAGLVPRGSSVVDLCCGDAAIAPALVARGASYLGLDLNPAFVRAGNRRGRELRVWDALTDPVPRADVVCMLSSLYQFIPDERSMVERMLESAAELVVLSEPVRNWTTSGSPLLRRAAGRLTRVDGRRFERRLDVERLRALAAELAPAGAEVRLDGRESLVLLRPPGASAPTWRLPPPA